MTPSQMNDHIAEFELVNGGRTAIKRKHVASVTEASNGDVWVTTSQGRSYNVDAMYADVQAWWLGGDENDSK